MVTEIVFDEEGEEVLSCVIEAVMTKSARPINWQTLKDSRVWLQGWK